MKCQKCKKKFNEAGNVKNYKIVCPHCKHIQKQNHSPIREKKTKLRSNRKSSFLDAFTSLSDNIVCPFSSYCDKGVCLKPLKKAIKKLKKIDIDLDILKNDELFISIKKIDKIFGKELTK